MSLPQQIGRYKIEKLLGSGAMGSVYQGFDPVIKRIVAIKTIKAEAIANHDDPDQFKKRFFNEARICGQLHHPNIVMLYDLGEESGTPFIAMEYLKGKSLQSVIKSQTDRDFDFCINVLEQLAAALDYAHQRDIIHRDIKPQNVMVSEDGTAKIMDFGIAKFSDSHMTKTGFFVGTPSYSSPEQIAGEKVDYRTDIFSLGVLAHELITGRLPFIGASISSVLYQVVNGLPSLDYIPPQLDTSLLLFKKVFLKVLNKDREKRHPKARAFVADMQELLASSLKRTLSLPTVSGIPRESGPFPKPPTMPTGLDLTDSQTDAVFPTKPDDVAQTSPTQTRVPVQSLPSPESSVSQDLESVTDSVAYPSSPTPAISTYDKPTVSTSTPVAQRQESVARQRQLAEPEPQRRFPFPLLIVMIPVLGFAGFLGYFLVNKSKVTQPDPTPKVISTQQSLLILSDPPGATLAIDGKPIGETPLQYEFDFKGENSINLVASLAEYASKKQEIGPDFDFGGPLRLSLEPIEPKHEVVTPLVVDDSHIIPDKDPVDPTPGTPDVTKVVKKLDPLKKENEFWTRVQKNPSLGSFQSYLDKYPEGKYRQRAVTEIQILRERQAYEQALNSNDESILGDFLASYPESRFAGAVRDRLRVFEMGRAFQSAVSGNDLASVNRVINDYAPYLTDVQRTRLEERQRHLEGVREEQTAFETARASNDLDVIKGFLNKYRDQNPWHTEEIFSQEKRVKETQFTFLQANLEHKEQTKYKMTKKRDGLDIVCAFRQQPTFSIKEIEVVWELEGIPQTPLIMAPNGNSFLLSIPHSSLKEGSVNYFFCVRAGEETYQLDKMWYQTRIQDARKKIVISY